MPAVVTGATVARERSRDVQPIWSLAAPAAAWLVNSWGTGRVLSFDVEEFALLADGRRDTLHKERGYTLWPQPKGDPWTQMTAENIESGVRTKCCLMTTTPKTSIPTSG
jgi:hypothetical protein